MGPSENSEPSQEADASPLRQRLGALKSMPVDLTGIQGRIRAEIPSRSEGAGWLRTMRPFRMAAASLLMGAVLVTLILLASGRPVEASPQRLAEIYREMSEKHTAHAVADLGEAREVLESQWPERPSIPEMREGAVFSCCIHKLNNRPMACVSVDLEGSTVSVAVGRSKDFRIPPGSTRTIGGRSYLIESIDGVNMVMTERGDRWVCVMGRVEIDRLVTFLDQMGD